MALPQIDAATCGIIVTLCLWMWTRLKLPEHCFYQEASLRRQNANVNWSFASLIGLEVLGRALQFNGLAYVIALLSGLVFYAFAIACYQREAGYWSKRRNQILGLVITLAVSFGVGLTITDASLSPLISALVLSHLCHKRYTQTIVSIVRDIETLHAKLLKQEASYTNSRHFDIEEAQPKLAKVSN